MDAKVDTKAQTGWQHDLYDLLRRHGITQFGYVPDAGHAILINRSLADPDVHSIALTTEEEGVALVVPLGYLLVVSPEQIIRDGAGSNRGSGRGWWRRLLMIGRDLFWSLD